VALLCPLRLPEGARGLPGDRHRPGRTPFALGADAVAIGRPVLWELAVAGVHGVLQVPQSLRSELDTALVLCGCGSVREVTHELVRLPGGAPC
jgi:hypothetical protein